MTGPRCVQSSIHYDNRHEMRGDVHLVGVKNDKDEVIAACLLTEARLLAFHVDYHNECLIVCNVKNVLK
jgi:lipid II:glycine glycyltransferase (peptidoglycan interpeptide bridge formation enzyme)